MVEAPAVVMADGVWFVNTSNSDTDACTACVAWETYVQHDGFVKPTMLTEYSSVYKGKEQISYQPSAKVRR